MKDQNWQVVSLELSKELKKAGYKQEGLWWWDIGYEALRFGKEVTEYGHDTREYAVAPTVAEMGIALANWQVVTRKINATEWSCYCVTKFAHTPEDQFADTEADCRAKMYLHLKEKGLL